MSLGLVGRKCGMTRIFTEEGTSIPVSVVQVLPNRITRVINQDADGYSAVQITTGVMKNSRVNKAEAGQFAKAGVEAGRGFWEFRLEQDSDLEVGSDLPLDLFQAGQKSTFLVKVLVRVTRVLLSVITFKCKTLRTVTH